MLNLTDLQKVSIPVNIPLIDSLKLRIPFNDCIIIDEKLTSLTSTIIEDTGEIVNEGSKPIECKFLIDGVTFRIQITQIPIYDEKTEERIPTKFLEIVLTSKLLKSNYFDCITNKNLKYFYNCFMSFKVFSCEYETFINSQVSDIDICINRYTNNLESFKDILNGLFVQSGTKQKHLRPINKDSNLGLMFKERKTAKPSLPYIKLYHKELELRSKSLDFYEKYLFPKYDYAIRNLTRIEATIRNSRHKSRLYKFGVLPEFKTLFELVNISKSDLLKFVKFSISSYITKSIRKKAPNLSPTDHIIFELIQNCVLSGYDFNTLLSVSNTFKGNSDQTTANGQSRIRKRVTTLYDLLIHKDLKLQSKANQNKHVISYLEYLGLKL